MSAHDSDRLLNEWEWCGCCSLLSRV